MDMTNQEYSRYVEQKAQVRFFQMGEGLAFWST